GHKIPLVVAVAIDSPSATPPFVPPPARIAIALPLRLQLKNRCQASFVCPYKSPQKLSFISARKCWKCSLIGIIFAIGCRSPFQERLSLVRQSQLTPSRLLHNQRYVTTGQAVPMAVEELCRVLHSISEACWYLRSRSS